ncbi:hypothetical protein VitviT2T_029710 [Vitis vinifera]|uniref:G-type lectin S-receptor-like serine/threonine-protein kinase n=1 Tax=Vitis vinifera TaxID=29760 RepID=A0ABY9DYA4_VITVI|nr:hypothetical protein VitviT2T_029710 [Vitis vinifera]
MDSLTTVAVIFSYVLSLLRISVAVDTIIVNQNITDGETITSAGGSFELGFFSPGNSKNRYLGIWYKKASKKPVVWVANRESPITDSSGVLKVTQPGILVLVNGTNGILWNSTSSRSAQDPNAQLLESGNLVMRNGNDRDPENFLWQSFDYPCDTLLPGMKLGRNRVAGLDRYLSSWKSADDPSKGNFTYWIDPSGFPQLLLRNGLAVAFRPGPWNEASSSINSSSKKKKKQVIIISISITGIVLLSLVLTLYVLKKRKKQPKRKAYMEHNSKGGENNEGQEHLELPLFDLDTLLNATNNFSSDNKLGEGGFGPVYKGILQEGQEIAVKMMSKTSRQGLKEFKNEVESIAKLQHRNLVKLLGCCIHGRERLLIYEHMPNKSLDLFIFDQMRRRVLDWPKRFLIINGIAQGLLYLHRDSRLRIIHRDLKAENILLDNEMIPKISDFGITGSFGGNEIETNTTRVARTLGYMSPEYAREGLYSTKSDVFSFGVLVLEIVSGKRNKGFNHPYHDLSLLGHAWTFFMEDRSSEFIDASMGNTCNLSEVLCSINLGLLCVQRFPEDRPSMHSVVLMLGSEGALPQPKEPYFFTDMNMMEGNCSSGTQSTITLLEA